MDATISLILSRHGETEENILHIMQGQMPGHLSALGKQQAEQLAELLESDRAWRIQPCHCRTDREKAAKGYPEAAYHEKHSLPAFLDIIRFI